MSKDMDREELLTIWQNLNDNERSVAAMVLRRIYNGRVEYGAWQPGDGRDNVAEALEEMVDAPIYIAMRLVEISKK